VTKVKAKNEVQRRALQLPTKCLCNAGVWC